MVHKDKNLGGPTTPREERQIEAIKAVTTALRNEKAELERAASEKDARIAKLEKDLEQSKQDRIRLVDEVNDLRTEMQRTSRQMTVPARRIGTQSDVLFFDAMKEFDDAAILIAECKDYSIVTANVAAEEFFGQIGPFSTNLQRLVLDQVAETPSQQRADEVSTVGTMPKPPRIVRFIDSLKEQISRGDRKPRVTDHFNLVTPLKGAVKVRLTIKQVKDRSGCPWLLISITDVRSLQTDALTGLFNREVLENSLDLMVKRRRRKFQDAYKRHYEAGVRKAIEEQVSPPREQLERTAAEKARDDLDPLSMVMVDVDFFKKVNDTHGHQAGDQVLRAVAKMLMKTIRQEDLVTRYGGEEFAGLLVDTDLAGAKIIAERVRSLVEEATIQAIDKHGIRRDIKVTVSVGVTTLHATDLAIPADVGGPAAELVRRADKALYEAKHGGRNQVRTVLYGQENAPNPKAA
jgi:diguanylate cyclase (GGDEF)-like protein